MKIILLIAIVGASLLSGCATNPMTGRNQLSLVSEKSVMAKGSQVYSTLISSYDKDGKINTDAALNQRVRDITNRLVEQAVLYRPDARDWNWQVSIIENPEINASCLPGGKMFIHTGFMEQLEPTDDEISQVMGHEISHALANHGAEKMSVQILANIAVATVAVAAVASSNSSVPNQQNQRAITDTAMLAANAFISLPNSRSAEEEADKLGIELAARAGYHPAAAVSLWKKMIEKTGQDSRVDFMSTHPASPKRVEFLESMQTPMLKIYEERKALYANYTPVHNYVQSANQSTNVREITGSSLTPAPEIDASKALVFYSADFESFKQGVYELTCDQPCAFGFFTNQKALKKFYEQKNWRQLVHKVMDTKYKLDLAYFYLAVAAEGLEYKAAAEIYYAKAMELSGSEKHACSKGVLIKCEDIDVAALSENQLKNRHSTASEPAQALAE